jgi:hypothetical protein
MRHSFFLHIALGLLSWSSQLVGASTEVHMIPAPRSGHLPRSEMRPHTLALTSTREAASNADADR